MLICEKCEKYVEDSFEQCPYCGWTVFESDIDEYVTRKLEFDDLIESVAFALDITSYGDLIYRAEGARGTVIEVYKDALVGKYIENKRVNTCCLLYHLITHAVADGNDLYIVTEETRRSHYKFTGINHNEIAAYHILRCVGLKRKQKSEDMDAND